MGRMGRWRMLLAVLLMAVLLVAVPVPVLAAGAAADTASDQSADNAVFDGTSASDHDLEMIVFGAYTGAYNQALKHGNYFESSDLPFAELRTAVRDALEKEGYGATEVATAPVSSAADAKTCTSSGRIELRFAFNHEGVGISVVAVSDQRMSAYDYDPSESSGLVITHADDCRSPGPSEGKAKADKLTAPAH